MLFDFSTTPDFDFVTYFARHIGATVENGLLVIPDYLGQGYARELAFGADVKITLHLAVEGVTRVRRTTQWAS